MRKLFLMGAILIASAAGCGGGGSSAGPTPTTAPTTTPTNTPSPTPTATAAPLPQTGGNVPASGVAAIGSTGYSFSVKLPVITSGPASGFVDANTTTTLTHGTAPSLPPGSGTALVYFGFLVTQSSGSGVSFATQPGFTVVLPAPPPAGTKFYVAESDPTAATPGYLSIAGPVQANGSTVTLPAAGSPTTLTTNTYYSYVFYSH